MRVSMVVLWVSMVVEAGGFRGGAACLSFFLQEAISLMLYAYLWGAALVCNIAPIYHV